MFAGPRAGAAGAAADRRGGRGHEGRHGRGGDGKNGAGGAATAGAGGAGAATTGGGGTAAVPGLEAGGSAGADEAAPATGCVSVDAGGFASTGVCGAVCTAGASVAVWAKAAEDVHGEAARTLTLQAAATTMLLITRFSLRLGRARGPAACPARRTSHKRGGRSSPLLPQTPRRAIVQSLAEVRPSQVTCAQLLIAARPGQFGRLRAQALVDQELHAAGGRSSRRSFLDSLGRDLRQSGIRFGRPRRG